MIKIIDVIVILCLEWYLKESFLIKTGFAVAHLLMVVISQMRGGGGLVFFQSKYKKKDIFR